MHVILEKTLLEIVVTYFWYSSLLCILCNYLHSEFTFLLGKIPKADIQITFEQDISLKVNYSIQLLNPILL